MSTLQPAGPTYQLAAPAAPTARPALDDQQRRVVEHREGPLLVLAGPGTGKTTTLVEAIVECVERRGVCAESVLALTFGRKAAEQLRQRVTARLGRTTAGTVAATFHSFAYGLVRTYSSPDLHSDPLRLLTAPEQDVIVRTLLDRRAAEAVRWPEGLRVASGTNGFAREVAEVLSRTTERGLGSAGLRTMALEQDRADLVAAADFIDSYDEVLASQNMLDYAGLVAEAVSMLQDPDHPAREELRARFTHVFVDEYQDTDPSQVALLRALAGDGRHLVAVGDPHQSIYAFRGADARGILEFPTRFPRSDGSASPVVVLGTARRFGSALLASAGSVAARIGLPGSIGPAERERFLHPQAASDAQPGVVSVRTFDTDRAEAEGLADLLRRAHLEDGLAWSEMAVLVRSGRHTIPALRRGLLAAGVPVELAADETALVQEPAVQCLLSALAVVADPGVLDADRAHALLISPMAALDATDVRALARALRGREPATAPARSSRELLCQALRTPKVLEELNGDAAAGAAAALGSLLCDARDLLESGGTVETVLWRLWEGTSWPVRLRSAAERGGSSARFAHRDLDAVVALFDAAARAEEQRGHTSVASFVNTLRAQQIPADTLSERGIKGDAVRMLTAHRSKGLEWRLVVVAHVQEESWPDLRVRSSLLGAVEIGPEGLIPAPSRRALLAEERRLFYVACTRARERLVVTAVASPDDDGEQPSRFLGELGVEPAHVRGRPERPMSLPGLVAELRRTLADEYQPDSLRDAAARRLVALAAERADGHPLVSAADPATWWGTLAATDAEAALCPPGTPVTVTASSLAAIEECPARWFWAREAGGVRAASQAQGFGNVVHALADLVGRGALGSEGSGPEQATDVVAALVGELDRVWPKLSFRTPWSAQRERTEAIEALTRFVQWQERSDARRLLATEREVRANVTLPGGEQIAIRGFADRLELDAQGRVVVVDLKTAKYPPADKDIAEHPQLGLYQLAVEQGAVDQMVDGPVVPGGAELWQLRKQVRGKLKVQSQPPLEAGEGRTVEDQLRAAAAIIRAEQFPTRPGAQCDRCDFQTMCPAVSSGTVLS